MMPGNRYAAALDPQAGGSPDASPQPPMGPQAAPAPGAPPSQAGPAAPSPALVEAFQILSGHEGPIVDLLKDPKKLPHIRIAFDAIKQDAAAQQQLAKIGITPQKMQQFETLLVQAEQGGKTGAVPHWLAS